MLLSLPEGHAELARVLLDALLEAFDLVLLILVGVGRILDEGPGGLDAVTGMQWEGVECQAGRHAFLAVRAAFARERCAHGSVPPVDSQCPFRSGSASRMPDRRERRHEARGIGHEGERMSAERM